MINAQFKPKEIIISYNPSQNKFEVTNSTTRNNVEWIPNISELFTSQSSRRYINEFISKLENYRKANGKVLSSHEEDIISNRIDALVEFKNYTLPVFSIKADSDEEDVAEIFVRVNSGGTPLKQNDFILTLLSLY